MNEIAQLMKEEKRESIQYGGRASTLSKLFAFPLLEYATTPWVAHVQQSEARNVSQEDLLSYFEWPSENLVQLYLRIQYEIDFSRSPAPGSCLIHVAAKYQLIGLLRTLLQRADQYSANINAKDRYARYARTPLSYAAESGHEAVVKLLIERDDVEADSKDFSGRTPLSYAAGSGHEAVVKLLLERNDIEVSSRDIRGLTPLFLAIHRRHEAVVKLLRSY